MLWGAVANFSLFTFHSSLNCSLFTINYSLLNAQSVQRGKASYYAKKATGARTANGEKLHHDSMTCAHRTLPFGTLLKVKVLSTGREIIVRVNDRGPFIRGRIIDLSWGAARDLGILAQGIAEVEVSPAELVHVPLRELPPIEVPRFEIELDQPELPWHFPIEH